MRVAGALWMVAFLLWLPVEDANIWLAIALALGACIWLAFRFRAHLSHLNLIQWLASGALAGIAAPLLTITLMAFKSGLHAHGFADFTLRQLWAVLASIPFTIAVGLFTSLMIVLLKARLTREHP
jgi:hypothetical protein